MGVAQTTVRSVHATVPSDEAMTRLLSPFWSSEFMESEPVLFVKESGTGKAHGAVLFPIAGIRDVRSSSGEIIYEEGRDYVWKKETRELLLPSGSRIPSVVPDDLRRPAKTQRHELTHRDGRGEILFGERLVYAGMQVCVTYQHRRENWTPDLHSPVAASLPRSIELLKRKQPFTIVVLGDSISTGLDSSAFHHGAPFQPGYPDLVRWSLASSYRTDVRLQNLAVDGKDSTWALTQVDQVVQVQPQLVILAFGMNDASGRPAADFKANIATVMAGIRTSSPETEFILVAPMLGHPDWIRLKPELFPAYRAALGELCGTGIALADLTSTWEHLLKRKAYTDLTGNGVNHPNDFGHRVYAQVIAALLLRGIDR